MKKVLLGILAVIVLYFPARWIYRELAADETKIRWLLEGMAEDFNRSRVGACADGLADGFRDETSGTGKDEVRAFLLHLYLTAREPKTKEFLYRVELPEESLEVNLPPGGESIAHVKTIARFQEVRGGGVKVIWEVRIDADLEKGGDGWKVKLSHHQTVKGRPPE